VNKGENVQIARFRPADMGPLTCETRFILFILYEVQTMAANAAICGGVSPQS
jgi:hypothetical protein